MATSSVTKNFVVYGERQAEIFANAIEESAKFVETPEKISVTQLKSIDEIRAFLSKRK